MYRTHWNLVPGHSANMFQEISDNECSMTNGWQLLSVISSNMIRNMLGNKLLICSLHVRSSVRDNVWGSVSPGFKSVRVRFHRAGHLAGSALFGSGKISACEWAQHAVQYTVDKILTLLLFWYSYHILVIYPDSELLKFPSSYSYLYLTNRTTN